MSLPTPVRLITCGAFALLLHCTAFAQMEPNSQPNPYRTVEHWFTLPEGRNMGSTSSVFVAPNGHVWVADRCGVNNCANSPLPPVFEFDESGKVLRNWGAG